MIELDKLKKEACKILEQGKIRFLIGYTAGTKGKGAVPARFDKPEEIEKLVWNPECRHNLVFFLVEEKKKEMESKEKNEDKTPIGLLVKGCDRRTVNVLLQEKFISREEVFLIGISCEKDGIIDRKKAASRLNGKKVDKWEFQEDGSVIARTGGQEIKFSREDILCDNCLVCRFGYPVTCDVLFGEKKERDVKNPFKNVEEIENMSLEKRQLFWKEQMEKCIRCYACRSVCPLCYCPECVVDPISFKVTPQTTAEEKAKRIKWIEKSPLISENLVYHLVRAIHHAGRCSDCGECELSCPQNIPIRLLNRKIEKTALEMFEYVAGLDPEKPPLFSSFRENDPEDFIR